MEEKMVKHLNTPPNHAKLVAWVEEWANLCKPTGIYWCNGTQSEYYRLAEKLVDSGIAKWLNPAKRPDSLWFTSDPSDVARVEARTYIASKTRKKRDRQTTGLTPLNSKKPCVDFMTAVWPDAPCM
jgi:Phosphoenolpyruvate carboxykinase (GTP)